MKRLKALFAGGSAGNEQLTATVAVALVLLLAVEGVTILRIRGLLTLHAFVGMLLIPVVVLKLASTGWRMLRYYRRGGATGVHVLVHLLELAPALRRRLPGAALRYLLVGLSLCAGAVLAVGTLPAADRLQDRATHFAGFDRN